MEELWNRIKAWLSENAPELLCTLQLGATVEQIAELEAAIGVQLPEDVRESFRIHNGQANYEFGLINGMELLSLERIRQEWKVWKDLLDEGAFHNNTAEPEQGIQNNWWNERWIPLTYDGSGNHYCLDLDPAPNGKYGQIITMWHDADERELIAKSYQEWLEKFATELGAGAYVYSAEHAGIVYGDKLRQIDDDNLS